MSEWTNVSVGRPTRQSWGGLSLASYAGWVVDHRRWVIAIVLGLTAFFGMFAAKQQVIINPAAVVPQSHPYILATNTIEKIFGSKYLVVIGITPDSGDALQPEVLEAVQRITDKLYVAPSVSKQTLLSISSRQAKGIKGSADSFEARPLLEHIPATEQGRAALKAAIIAQCRAHLDRHKVPVSLSFVTEAWPQPLFVCLDPNQLQDALLNLFSKKTTAVMTNVPGPVQKLQLCGATLEQNMFWVPASGDIGVGVSILSYGGGVQFGCIADTGLCPDPQAIVDRFTPEFQRLLTLTLMLPWGESD